MKWSLRRLKTLSLKTAKGSQPCERMVRLVPMRWLVDEWQWPYAGALASVFLLALLPLVWDAEGAALALVYVQLPVYMLHQLEEHAGDRFRTYLNRVVAGGREALTPVATFWINVVGVWALDLVALYLARYVELALGLIAVYLTAVNAVVHVATALARREYNPGLLTAVFLFVPLSAWAAVEVSSASGASWGFEALGLGVAVAGHAAILVGLRVRLARI